MRPVLDFAIIGGGLAGCLTYQALKARNPRLNVHLFEKSAKLCGNHTWCFHDSDIPDGAKTWLEPLVSKTWAQQDVHFPGYSRTLATPYHCIKSEDLARATEALAGPALHFDHELESAVETPEGLYELRFRGRDESVLTHSYLCARGWPAVSDPKESGWQKFVGLEIKLKKPHDLSRVILKDVRIPQIDGYRFFYVLPFSPNELLIEDTYYSNHPLLKTERIEKEVLAYAERHGWQIESIHRRESGVLPLYLHLPKFSAEGDPEIGAASQFVHPVTGYTLPMTLKMIQSLVDGSNLTTGSIRKILRRTWDREKSRLHYLVLLNRMMFWAAKNETRYKILERFYTFPEPLIDRFYAGRLNWWDRVRILTGKPPVPVADAVRALRGHPESRRDEI